MGRGNNGDRKGLLGYGKKKKVVWVTVKNNETEVTEEKMDSQDFSK